MEHLARRIKGKVVHLWYERIGKFLKTQGCVLMLHEVGGDDGQFNLSVSSFNRLVETLRDKNVIRLENWTEASDFYALSIDDVPEGFYHHAFPVLKRNRLPFTIFVSTSLLDKVGYLTTEQLQEIASCDLCTVGSHGRNHVEYCTMSEAEALYDLRSSKFELEQIVGRPVSLYAFPYGSFYACGYKYKHLVSGVYDFGFGTVQMPITHKQLLPDYFLPRINVDESFIEHLL